MRADTPEDWSTNSLGARREGDLLDELAEERRDLDRRLAVALDPGLLRRDLRGRLHVVGVVRQDLRGDPVLQRRDDVAAVRVVLRVGGEDEQDVERDPHGESADLEVALLEDVQQADLDARLQVGQLVDREDAAVRARDDPEVDDLLVGVGAALGRRLDRVDVADQVGDRDVRRRELLAVPLVARDPGDRRRVALLGDHAPAVLRDRAERVLVELAAGDRRDLRVEQVDEHAQQARLRLARAGRAGAGRAARGSRCGAPAGPCARSRGCRETGCVRRASARRRFSRSSSLTRPRPVAARLRARFRVDGAGLLKVLLSGKGRRIPRRLPAGVARDSARPDRRDILLGAEEGPRRAHPRARRRARRRPRARASGIRSPCARAVRRARRRRTPGRSRARATPTRARAADRRGPEPSARGARRRPPSPPDRPGIPRRRAARVPHRSPGGGRGTAIVISDVGQSVWKNA